MFRLDDATEQGVKYQKRFYKADERCKTLGVRVSDLQSTIAELKEKFQVSAEHISCLQKSALDIPSSFFQRTAVKVKDSKMRAEYPETLRCFALTLHSYSACAYRY